MVTELTPVDLARVTVAVAAHGYRYVKDGALSREAACHLAATHLPTMPGDVAVAAVLAELVRRPRVATFSRTEAEGAVYARGRHCDMLAQDAASSTNTGDYAAALAALAEGELLNPDHQVGGRSWADMAAIVAGRQGATSGDC